MAGKRADDGPVLACLARREGRAGGILHAPLGIQIDAVLLGIGSTRQDDVGDMRAGIAVMPLIDGKGLFEPRSVDLVGGLKPDQIQLAGIGSLVHRRDVQPAAPRRQAKVKPGNARSRCMKHVEAVPVAIDDTVSLGDLARLSQHSSTVGAR